jgi:hypothetical protein
MPSLLRANFIEEISKEARRSLDPYRYVYERLLSLLIMSKRLKIDDFNQNIIEHYIKDLLSALIDSGLVYEYDYECFENFSVRENLHEIYKKSHNRVNALRYKSDIHDGCLIYTEDEQFFNVRFFNGKYFFEFNENAKKLNNIKNMKDHEGFYLEEGDFIIKVNVDREYKIYMSKLKLLYLINDFIITNIPILTVISYLKSEVKKYETYIINNFINYINKDPEFSGEVEAKEFIVKSSYESYSEIALLCKRCGSFIRYFHWSCYDIASYCECDEHEEYSYYPSDEELKDAERQYEEDLKEMFRQDNEGYSSQEQNQGYFCGEIYIYNDFEEGYDY